MNGIQVLEKIRKFCNLMNASENVKVKEPTFIFLTAYSTIALKKHLKSLQVNLCFEKPLH